MSKAWYAKFKLDEDGNVVYQEDFDFDFREQSYTWEQIEAAWNRVYPESTFIAPLQKLKQELENDS